MVLLVEAIEVVVLHMRPVRRDAVLIEAGGYSSSSFNRGL